METTASNTSNCILTVFNLVIAPLVVTAIGGVIVEYAKGRFDKRATLSDRLLRPRRKVTVGNFPGDPNATEIGEKVEQKSANTRIIDAVENTAGFSGLLILTIVSFPSLIDYTD